MRAVCTYIARTPDDLKDVILHDGGVGASHFAAMRMLAPQAAEASVSLHKVLSFLNLISNED